MKIDIIGSKFTRKLTEFKNFRFEVNNIVEGQSILSLLSEPYETAMKDINTTDLTDITVAYRDLNKLLYSKLKSSDSDILIIELLSEINDISEFAHSYYNTKSLQLLKHNLESKKLSNIEKFRALQEKLHEFLNLIRKYDKVIFIKILPKEKELKNFIEGLYKSLEYYTENKLILNVNNDDLDDNLDGPLEFYNTVNEDLRKFSSNNYFNQLLFDESMEDNILSVYVNHVEEREYVYELYKDGQLFKSTSPTINRYCEFLLDETGKYRIRVNLTNEEIKPRFSQIYEYSTLKQNLSLNSEIKCLELPSNENLWMLDLLLLTDIFDAIVGNAYKYPDGYKGINVLLPEETQEDYFKKDELFETVLHFLPMIKKDKLKYFLDDHENEIKRDSYLKYEFLNFITDN